MKAPEVPSNLPKANFSWRFIYVIDDDSDLRRSLHFLLETRQATVRSFANACDFLQEVEDLSPSPLIVDVRMPHMDGLELIAELTRREVAWPAIFLSAHADVSIAVRALKLGAADFLEKPVVTTDLEVALANAFDKLDQQSLALQVKRDAAERWSRLTPREKNVLELLCKGHANKVVAFQLGISARTVEMHRANALRQLQVRSLPEVIALRSQATDGLGSTKH